MAALPLLSFGPDAMTISLIGEVVNSADATTGFNVGNISGDDDFVEGSGAIGLKASATLAEMYTTSLGAGAPYDFSSGGSEEGFHIIMWFNTKTPVAATGGLRIIVGTSTARGHWFVEPVGFYKGGFITALIDPERRFENIAAGAFTLSGNPSQLSAIDRMGGVFDTITSIMGSFNNVQLDQITIGLGLRADGSGNSFETVRATDESTNFWGWWSSKNGAFVGKGKLFIGPATGSATCTFADSSVSVVFANERVAEGFYEINARGAGTDITWNLLGLSAANPLRPYDISNVGVAEARFDVVGDDTVPRSLRFRDDGTRVFYLGNGTDSIYQRTLSTAWDLNSAGSSSSLSINADAPSPFGLWFGNSGTRVYYTDGTSSAGDIYERTLGTAWDVTSAGSSSTIDVSADEGLLRTIMLDPTGTRMYYSGDGNDTVFERLLSTAWDITSAGSVNASFDFSSFSSSIIDLQFNEDGTIMFLAEGSGIVYQCPLSTPYDLSTMSAPEATGSFVKATEGDLDGMTFGDGGKRVFICESNNNFLIEVNMGNFSRWNLTVQSDTNSFSDIDGVWSGADQLDLDDSVSMLRTTFIDCNNIVLNGADMDECSVLNSYLDLGEAFILASTLATIADTSFTASKEGHAIEIDTAGTYSHVGNQYTGYGPGTCDDTGAHDHEFDTIDDVDAGADTITITGDPFVTGDPVYYSDEGGSDTIGLTDDNLYYVRRTAASTYQIHNSVAEALADVNAITLSDGSTGEAHVLYSARAAIYNSSGGTVTINISGGGDTPSIRNSSGSTTIVNNNVSLTLTGLKDNTEVRVYADGTLNELDGVENATDGTTDNRSVTFSLAAGITVDIRFAHGTAADGKVYSVPPANTINNFIWPSSTTSIPITQILDRTFNNP